MIPLMHHLHRGTLTTVPRHTTRRLIALACTLTTWHHAVRRQAPFAFATGTELHQAAMATMDSDSSIVSPGAACVVGCVHARAFFAVFVVFACWSSGPAAACLCTLILRRLCCQHSSGDAHHPWFRDAALLRGRWSKFGGCQAPKRPCNDSHPLGYHVRTHAFAGHTTTRATPAGGRPANGSGGAHERKHSPATPDDPTAATRCCVAAQVYRCANSSRTK